ncbi:hypothetical protein OH805_02585 [Streptomyces sp. NBC_00879]|uniref:hypothetical protein n=1 Tax=Streptomyces sp. NBC_00879 TaxID=2975855 RepID=UPI00386DD9F4|nr:hypothetical protein OH805_02585 [Streptomyces sp. NBC_00879]
MEEDHGIADGPLGTAAFNTSRTHRYLLTRLWDPAGPLAVFRGACRLLPRALR